MQLRLRPDGTPNADWRVELDYGYDVTATVTRQGLLLVGRFRQAKCGVRRSGAALVSLNGGAIPLDWTPGAEPSGRSYVYDGRDTLYVAADDANYRIRRPSMLNGQFDTDWHISAGSWLGTAKQHARAGCSRRIWLQRDAQTYFMEPDDDLSSATLCACQRSRNDANDHRHAADFPQSVQRHFDASSTSVAAVIESLPSRRTRRRLDLRKSTVPSPRCELWRVAISTTRNLRSGPAMLAMRRASLAGNGRQTLVGHFLPARCSRAPADSIFVSAPMPLPTMPSL